jgi:hypothetical protein
MSFGLAWINAAEMLADPFGAPAAVEQLLHHCPQLVINGQLGLAWAGLDGRLRAGAPRMGDTRRQPGRRRKPPIRRLSEQEQSLGVTTPQLGSV